MKPPKVDWGFIGALALVAGLCALGAWAFMVLVSLVAVFVS